MLCTLDVPIAVLDGVRWQIHPTCHFFAKNVASTVENKFKTMIYCWSLDLSWSYSFFGASN
jgi:hypothetical protein